MQDSQEVRWRTTAIVAICACAILAVAVVLVPHVAAIAAREECALIEQRLLAEILRRCPARRTRSTDTMEENQVGYYVEFHNPKTQAEVQAKGDLTPEGDSWVWVNSYSRIPYPVVEGFCKATKDYCAFEVTSPPGKDGRPGEPGERGLPGIIGKTGPIGPFGPKGEQGWPGHPGLDGRDGVPGEPGLDGVPGRNGADGAMGLPGRNGTDGIHGRNGTDGKHGTQGPPGPPGPMGPRGLSGPRGKVGKPGSDGTPGHPGISTWMYNDTTLLIPPSVGGRDGEIVIVQENESVQLRCDATGQPIPAIQWASGPNGGISGGALKYGLWRTSSLSGPTIEMPRVSRVNSGAYTCTAFNGVSPQANRTIYLEVHFPPLIRIKNQMIRARSGSSVQLECEVEAFPEPVRYWERSDGKLIEGQDRNAQPDFINGAVSYRSIMRLRLARVTSSDFGTYHCIAKNELGLTKGVFTLYEQDPMLGTPPTIDINLGQNEWGPSSPPLVTLEELCPAPTCPTCPRCSDPALNIADLVDHLNIQPMHAPDRIIHGLSKRVTDCVLYAIGKPVYHRFTDEAFGSWMRDAASSAEPHNEKIWVTKEGDHNHLFEFANKSAYRDNKHPYKIKLDQEYVGNGHIVYKESFYFCTSTRLVARFDLSRNRTMDILDLPGAAKPLPPTTTISSILPISTTKSPSEVKAPSALYSTGHTYMDFNVDDNGLWIIYSMENSNNTAVAKIDPDTLQIYYIWNISINHHKIGEMFIVCGVLYAVDSATERNTKVRLALDLYRNTLLEVLLPFTNPFRRTTVLSYNHRNRELYSWDKGNQLTYPVRYHEIGYNMSQLETSLQPPLSIND